MSASIRARIAGLMCVSALIGCGQEMPHVELSPADHAAIRATTDRWLLAVYTQHWHNAAATFTDDAILWFGGTKYEGRAEIQRFMESMPTMDSTRLLHIDEISGRGDLAFVTGHATVQPPGGGARVVVSRTLDIRLRQPDGTWLFFRDMVTPIPLPPATRP